MWNYEKLEFLLCFYPTCACQIFYDALHFCRIFVFVFFCLKEDTTIMEYHFHKRVSATMPM